MPTRFRVALALMLIAAGGGDARAQERTEQDIVEIIVRDGPRARAIRAASDVVTFAQAARRVYPNPAASYSREEAGFTEFLMVDQPLPAFGLRSALERAGVAAREAAEAERDAQLWQLRSDAHDAIARLRASAQRLESARSLVGLVEGLIGVLSTREREGEGSKFDRLRAQQELVDAQQVVIAATVVHAEARSAVAAMLPPGVIVPDDVPRRITPATTEAIDAMMTRAMASRAELRALNASVRQFGLEADVARRAAGVAPTVSAGLKRAEVTGDTHSGAVLGVSVAVPLFNRGTREAERWTAERTRTEFERTALEADIRAQITRAFEALAIRRRSTPAVTAAVSSADELITIADVAYREGEIGMLQLVDAYRTAARARERVIEASLNLALSETALERAVGVSLWP
jgi:cobalt-zinc-cadmium efflux system outer membrane protein